MIRRRRFSTLRNRIVRSSTLHALRFCLLLASSLLALPGQTANAADKIALAELARPGRLLMLRHASAPGTGDPPHFRLDDCATQRNLDAGGRAQAAALGKRLARAGALGARVYSSQWCRCLETARLLELGPVEPLPALNSFFGRPQQREATIAVLRDFLAAIPPGGPPIVLVTHQFTINAFTGEGTLSAGGSLFELNGTGAPRLLGAIESD